MAGVKGRSGRKPKPTRIKELAGTLRADRTNPNEPTLPALDKVPRCPLHLKGEARLAWRRVGGWLTQRCVLTEADLYCLEAYCSVFARWREAEAHLTEGVIGDDYNIYLRIANRWAKQLRLWTVELGLTPATRLRVSTAAKAEDPLGQIFFGRRD